MVFYIIASLAVLVASALLAVCFALRFKTNAVSVAFWYLQNHPFMPKWAVFAWCLTQYYSVAAALFWYIYDVLKDCYMRNGIVYFLIVPYLHWIFIREVMAYFKQGPKEDHRLLKQKNRFSSTKRRGLRQRRITRIIVLDKRGLQSSPPVFIRERGGTLPEETGASNIPDPEQTKPLNSTAISEPCRPGPTEVHVNTERSPIEESNGNEAAELEGNEAHGGIALGPVHHSILSACQQAEVLLPMSQTCLLGLPQKTIKARQIPYYSYTSNITKYSGSEPETEMGMVIIINIVNFHPDLKMEPRVGSELDEDNIEKTFTHSGMNYDVFKIRDKTSVDLMVELTRCAELANDNNRYQSFAIFVLSHGDKGQILATDGQPIAMSTIANTFSTKQHPNLDGKPRVVIFQACLGNKKPEFTTGVLKDDLPKACHEGNDKENAKQLQSPKEAESDHFTDPIQFIDPITDEHSIPSADGPDFVFGFATLPGCTAIRTSEGSPFIKLLMDEIRSDINHGHQNRKSVIEMLQTVNDRMLQDYGICIQMSSTARRSIAFRRQT